MQKKLTITIEALQKFAGCNRQALLAPPTHNPLTTRKRSVIPTNTQFLAAFRATKGVARQNQKDPFIGITATIRLVHVWEIGRWNMHAKKVCNPHKHAILGCF